MSLTQLKDLPQLSDMTPEQLKGLFGGGKYSPQMEALEQRMLLAGNIDFANGILTIEGDAYQDVAHVRVVGDELRVDLYSAENANVQIDPNNPQNGRGVDHHDSDFDLEDVSAIYFRGFGGNDYFYSNAGVFTFADGGAGNDFLNLSEATGWTDLHGDAGDDRIYAGSGGAWIGGGAGNDYLVGGAGNDFLYAHEGNDTVYGGLGNDYMLGHAGDDLLQGGDGDDSLYGHEGNDRLFGDAGNDVIYGAAGNDYLRGGTGNDFLSGQAGNDWLYGDDGNDRVYGDEGNDYLSGASGDDWLYGGSGDDRLYGGSGRDYLYGQDGADYLDGGYDGVRDYLYGGAGPDKFVRDWNWRNSRYNLAKWEATVMDFKSGEDTIVHKYHS